MNWWFHEEMWLHTGDAYVYSGDERPCTVADIDPEGNMLPAEAAAAGRLMAAAPDLFAALDALIKAEPGTDEYTAAMRAGIIARAKARGRVPERAIAQRAP